MLVCRSTKVNVDVLTVIVYDGTMCHWKPLQVITSCVVLTTQFQSVAANPHLFNC